jgi:cytosine/creatinine deaminase
MMSFDLLVKGGHLPDGAVRDIAIKGDRIVAVEPQLPEEAGKILDARGQLVSPPFCDPHFHLDAALSYGLPRVNQSGTLFEGIALWGELRQVATQQDMVDRALAYIDWAVSMGLLATRTHVDTSDDRLLGVDALLEVKKKVASYFDLQIVAFPQDGYYRSPNNVKNVERALDRGVDIVGGIPHAERTMEDGRLAVIAQCEIAAKRGIMIDLHCDESDDPLSRHIETLAAEAKRLGLQGRAVGSHCTSMHSMDNYYAGKLINLIAESGVAIVPNPLINITLQGRSDTYPKRRGLTRVPELLKAGVTVGYGQDCVLDPWYPLGTADMLDVAFMGLNTTLMTSPPEMRATYDLVTINSAKLMRLEGYGLEVGCKASLVILEANDPVEAIRLRANRTTVISKGKIVSERPSARATLHISGRPNSCDRRFLRK